MGFVFALAVLVLSVVSFPLLLDRDVGVGTAIATSIEVVRENPGPMALWGLIIAGLLRAGLDPAAAGPGHRVPGAGPRDLASLSQGTASLTRLGQTPQTLD